MQPILHHMTRYLCIDGYRKNVFQQESRSYGEKNKKRKHIVLNQSKIMAATEIKSAKYQANCHSAYTWQQYFRRRNPFILWLLSSPLDSPVYFFLDNRSSLTTLVNNSNTWKNYFWRVGTDKYRRLIIILNGVWYRYRLSHSFTLPFHFQSRCLPNFSNVTFFPDSPIIPTRDK